MIRDNQIKSKTLESSLGEVQTRISEWKLGKVQPNKEKWKNLRSKDIIESDKDGKVIHEYGRLGELFNKASKKRSAGSSTAAAEPEPQQAEASSLATATEMEEVVSPPATATEYVDEMLYGSN